MEWRRGADGSERADALGRDGILGETSDEAANSGRHGDYLEKFGLNETCLAFGRGAIIGNESQSLSSLASNNLTVEHKRARREREQELELERCANGLRFIGLGESQFNVEAGHAPFRHTIDTS